MYILRCINTRQYDTDRGGGEHKPQGRIIRKYDSYLCLRVVVLVAKTTSVAMVEY